MIMIPTRVALFPYDKKLTGNSDFIDELMLVASALQTQVTRDVGPVWGVSAVVSAFSSLDLVPDGYLPIGITSGGSLPLNRAGFHYTEAGQPAALIEYCGDWSSSASHELIEMLCDPSGTKTITAPSLGDLKNAAGGRPVVVKTLGDYEEQGLVAYLMEVCDPVEQSTYKIGTVSVSDFVTPDFYVLQQPPESFTRYSFTGRVRSPLELLEGGYITWATQAPNAAVFQAFGRGDGTAPVPTSALEIKRVDAAPQVLSRSWIDANEEAKEEAKAAPCDSAWSYVAPKPPAKEAGQRTQIAEAQAAMDSPADLNLILDLVRRFQQKSFRDDFERDPTDTLASLNIAVPSGLPPRGTKLGWNLPDPEEYQKLQAELEKGHRVGYSFKEPGAVMWLARLPGG